MTSPFLLPVGPVFRNWSVLGHMWIFSVLWIQWTNNIITYVNKKKSVSANHRPEHITSLKSKKYCITGASVWQIDRKDFVFMAYKNANERTCVTTSLTKEQKSFLDSYSAYMNMSKAAFMAYLVDEFRGRPEVASNYRKIRSLEKEIQEDREDQDQAGANRSKEG